ncbi:glutathione S-transferase zeta class-like isoform X2 [Euphorbia lathyris]|uniref:glutathione S-transferase zeta class-like isoform X2 n=1 Tax=Euphorbia lathyris TaxID=212925 RepID=UPI003313CBC3
MEAANQRNPGNSSTKLILYSYWQSSCSWRIRFALNLKGLSYEYRAVDLLKGEQFSPEFERLNPLHYVPVLVDGDVVVSDSYAIFLYLEEKYPQKPLLPDDLQLRAINLQAASVVNSSLQPLTTLSLLRNLEVKIGPEETFLWAQSVIEKGFLALEKLLKVFSGKYATGEAVYMSDVFLAPQIAVAMMRFKMDMTKFPTLSRIYESYKSLPEFEASFPTNNLMLQEYSHGHQGPCDQNRLMLCIDQCSITRRSGSYKSRLGAQIKNLFQFFLPKHPNCFLAVWTAIKIKKMFFFSLLF